MLIERRDICIFNNYSLYLPQEIEEKEFDIGTFHSII